MKEQIQFQLRSKTPEELVELFNKEVGVKHWVSARSRFLHALRDAFESQDIDYSCVQNDTGGFNLAKGNEVFLEEKRLLPLAYKNVSEQVIKLVSSDLNYTLPIIKHVRIERSSVYVSDFSKESDIQLFFVAHDKLSTYLNLDGICNRYLIGFTEQPGNKYDLLTFDSAVFINEQTAGGFSYICQSRVFYLVKAENFGAQHKLHLANKTMIHGQRRNSLLARETY